MNNEDIEKVHAELVNIATVSEPAHRRLWPSENCLQYINQAAERALAIMLAARKSAK